MKTSVALAIVFLFPGCLGPAFGGEQSGTTSEVGPSDADSVRETFINLDGCRGGNLGVLVPDSFRSEVAPEGWQQDGHPLTEVRIDFFACQRIGYGLVETRETMMILLSQNGYEYPDACRVPNDRFVYPRILLKAWATSPDLAAELASQIHMPIAHADWRIEWPANDLGGAVTVTHGDPAAGGGRAEWRILGNESHGGYEDGWFGWFEGNLTHVLYLRNDIIRTPVQYTPPLIQASDEWQMTIGGETPPTTLGGVSTEMRPEASIVTFTGPACSGGQVNDP